MTKTAAFFDMDRTLLHIDTGLSWARYLRRRGEISNLYFVKTLYWGLLYKAALLDMDSLADRVAKTLRGDSATQLRSACHVWFGEHAVDEVASAGLRAIENHRQRGETVVLLTGASQIVADIVCDRVGIEHNLSTVFEVKDDAFTGQVAQRCFGKHKVTVAERFAREHDIDLDASTFYSDSYNDVPMLARVGTAIAINPDARLARHATRQKWPVEHWR